jgi:Gas vesicle synthesis protein GvpO
LADEEPEERRRPRARRKPDADTQAATDNGRPVPAALAARRAAQQVAEFTGRSPECVVSIDREDGGWQVGVEVVEIRRIPDTQDILAIYEVHVDRGGRLLSYQRTRRYARGELDGRGR